MRVKVLNRLFLSNRSGLIKSEIQLVQCAGWRDISNSTGHHPVERIMADPDHAQQVNSPSRSHAIPPAVVRISQTVHVAF